MTIARTPPPARQRIVVSSVEPGRRRELAALLHDDADEVIRCCGPFEGCLLAEGRVSCPMLASAAFAVIDPEGPCHAFLRHAERDHPDLELRYARGATASAARR